MPRGRKKNMEEKQIVDPTPEPEDSVAEKLKALGASLIQAADDEVASQETMKKIEQLLGNLKIKDYPKLADSEVVQTILGMLGTKDLRPGEVSGRGTLAERDREWTWTDLQKMIATGEMPIVTLNHNGPQLTITWNGLMLTIPEDGTVQLPRCFYDIYQERRYALRQANINEHFLLGLTDTPPHPNWQTPEGAVVRAISIEARKHGKPGGSISTGPIRDYNPPSGPITQEGATE